MQNLRDTGNTEKRRQFKLICVTDRHSIMPQGGEEQFLQRLHEIASSRVDAIILRERDMTPLEYKALAARVTDICRQAGCMCILHRYAEQARALGAEYVHLSVPALKDTPQKELQGFKGFGVSCHSAEEAVYAQQRGASYILAGHVYDTTCKLGTPGRGLAYLHEMCSSVHIPVYAIGGISKDRVQDVINTGAAGVCSMSGFMQTPDPAQYALDMTYIMPLQRPELRLYAITDTVLRSPAEEAERVRFAVAGGATMIQLRKKTEDTELLEQYARAISWVCRAYGVPFIINDNVPVAFRFADGVHLGGADASVAEVRAKAPRGFIIGAPAKTVEQAMAAEAAGADYIGVGAMFPSRTKENAIRITREQLDEICASVRIPAVCIGGISGGNIMSLKGCRAAGAAVIEAIYGQEDILAAAGKMRSLAEEAFI